MDTQKLSSTGVERRNIERLFVKILIVGTLLALITLIIQISNNNPQELFFSSLGFLFCLSTYVIFTRFNKTFAYHLFLSAVNFLILYQIVILGSRYEAILLFYAISIIYCFLFFENFKVLLPYLIYLIISQLIVTYYNSDSHIHGFDQQMFAEYANIICFNIVIFLMAYFYISNLIESKIKLDNTTRDLEAQRLLLSKQNIELGKYIESNKQLENYTHLAAHELKAPLRSIQGFSSILQKKLDTKLDPTEKELFAFVTTGASKMSNLLTDLGQLGRVSKMEIKIEEIDLQELFEEIKRDRGNTILETKATVEFDEEIKMIKGQRSLIKQLFSNLVGNGLKFVEKNTTPHVKIDSTQSGDFYYFKFMDNGIGIEPKFRDKIFQIFTRLHSEAKFEGSGIGLAICKKIVDLHKGTISIEDSELGGTCFNIRIPILEE